MKKKIPITTNAAPPAAGSYTQAIRAGDFVFLTGQTGRDPETGNLVEGLKAQTRCLLDNIEAVLSAAGCSREDIVKVTLILADLKEYKAIDQIYVEWLPDRGQAPYPTRTSFQAAALPAGAKLMLDVVALIPD